MNVEVSSQDGPLPRDFHNLFVVIVVAILCAWVAKVGLQLFRVAELNSRLGSSQPLQLEGMSIYASEFQMLIRQHFNQILRIRRTVPSKPVARHSLSVHLDPATIEVVLGSDGTFGVQFSVDAAVPCCVQLYWGVAVAACNDFAQRRSSAAAPWGERGGGAGGHDAPSGRRGGSGGRSSGSAGDASHHGAVSGVGRGGSRGHHGQGRWPTRQGAGGAAQESTLSLLEMEQLGEAAVRSGAGRAEVQGSIFAAGQYVAMSREFFLPAGLSQRYVTPGGDLVTPSQLSFDVAARWLREGAPEDSAVVPLAIVIAARRRTPQELGTVQGRPVLEAHGEVSLVKFRRDGEGAIPRAPEVIRQLTFGDNCSTYELHGIYGFEDETEVDCMICYSRAKNVLMLPCRHCAVCHQCLRSLRDEKCPLCRSIFSSYVSLPIARTPTPQATPVATSTSFLQASEPDQDEEVGAAGASSAGELRDNGRVQAARHTDHADDGPAEHSGAPASNADSELLQPSSQAARSRAADAAAARAATAAAEAAAATAAAATEAALAPSSAAAASGSAAASAPATASSSSLSSAGATHGEGGQPRQARDVQLGRPRGLAPRAGQPRLSGRARFQDKMDNADMPLLRDAGGAPGGTPPSRAAGAEAAGSAEATGGGGAARCGRGYEEVSTEAAVTDALVEEREALTGTEEDELV
mmetsp:Transcript_55806/g.181209  ORF Transcript_55806/g.181209 Transcript_55806/m.181209 type:complete len:693 (+) Transcript_55806:769-2847(+)